MKNNVIKLVGLFSLLGILTIACDKNENDSVTPELSAEELILAMDDAVADDIYNDIDASVQDEIVELEEQNFQPVDLKSSEDDFTCMVRTVDHPDSTRFPKVITLDYGTGCRVIFNGDTIFKEGKIIITLTDHFFKPGAQRIMTFEDFYINEMKVEGVITNTYNGLNDEGLLEFEHQVQNGKLIFADNDGNRLVYTREADILKEWFRARTPIDDTVYLSGSMWGVNVQGLDYSREIMDKLTLVHCPGYGRRWVIIDGIVVNSVGGVGTQVDYTDGGCDGTAEIFRRGIRKRIRIWMHHRNRSGGNGGNGGN